MTETRYEVLHETGALLADFDNRAEAVGWAKAHPRAHRVVERVYSMVVLREDEIWRLNL